MYIPEFFKNENTEEIRSFINTYNFGILVSHSENKLIATHIPFVVSVDEKKIVLSGHISRANSQLQNITSEEEVLVIFQGPNAYISSSWYDHENVPTWNYMAVHVYGTLRIIEGEELYQSLRLLVNKHEAGSQHPVSVDTMSRDFLNKEMKGIIGFEIKAHSIEAAKKLSQNRDAKNYKRIAEELEKSDEQGAKEIAREMKNVAESLPKKTDSKTE